SPAHWREAADTLEQTLGLVGHQRALVGHVKHGRPHLHIVWNRLDPVTLRAVHDGRSYARHERCARVLEQRWGLRPVMGVHSRPRGTRRPVAKATHADWQAQQRTGLAVADVASTLKRCWSTTDDGLSFRAAVEGAGLSLASGRRGIVI